MQFFRPVRPPRNACSWLAATALVSVVTPLRATTATLDDRLQLTWTAPPQCPSKKHVRADVRSLVARKSISILEPVTVEAKIQVAEDGRYALSVLANGQTRKISGPSCARLAQAAALLMALLLDPELAEPDSMQVPSVPEDPGRGAADKASGPTAQAKADDRSANATRSRVEPTKESTLLASFSRDSSPTLAFVELGGRLDVGAWPGLEPVVTIGAGIERSHWRILARAGLGKPVRLRPNQGGQIELIPMAIGIEPAHRFVYRRWGLETGVGAELGITYSHSRELEPAEHSATSLAVLVQMRGTRELAADLRGWIGIGTAIPILRPRWLSEDGELLHAFGPALRGELGLQMRF